MTRRMVERTGAPRDELGASEGVLWGGGQVAEAGITHPWLYPACCMLSPASMTRREA